MLLLNYLTHIYYTTQATKIQMNLKKKNRFIFGFAIGQLGLYISSVGK